MALFLEGEVKSYISMEPGGYVSLQGVMGRVSPEHIEIINNTRKPLKLSGIDTDLKNRIKWHLRELKPGAVYRLDVEDISGTAGDYFGHLRVRTNIPEKPELLIIINGRIEKDPGADGS
jgi:hypothetical protein